MECKPYQLVLDVMRLRAMRPTRNEPQGWDDFVKHRNRF